MILNVIRGDKTTIPFTLPDGVEQEGATVTFTAKRRLLDPDDDAVISKVLPEGEGQAVALVLLPEDTTEFTDAERLPFDLQVDDGIGNVVTPFRGTLVISADVTLTAEPTS